MIDILKPLIKQFMPFAQQEMGFSRPPRLFLRQDAQNATNPLGKTGFYDPQAESITLYTTGRHPKDIMRSLAHELMHHTQKCNGDFDNTSNMGEQGYAQNDPHMRNMEIQAYQASIVFRDWEDSLKETIYYEHLQKGDKGSMSTKKWKNGELKSLLSEAWGFKMDLSRLNEERSGSGVDHGGDDDAEAKEETEGTADSAREEEGLAAARKQRKEREAHQRSIRGLEEERDAERMRKKRDRQKEREKAEKEAGDKGRKGLGEELELEEERDAERMRKKRDRQKEREKAEKEAADKGRKTMHEDSGDEEKRHYEDNAWSDEDHIEAIEKHLRALKKDRDYDEDHEALEEDGAKRKGDPRLRRTDADRLRESVTKLHKAGLSERQIAKFLTASISRVLKG